MTKKEFIKSPLNYTGGKYKLLKQITPLFPNNVNTFVDLFCGGGNVAVNVKAQTIVCNDILSQVIDLYKYWKENGYDNVKKYIMNRVEEFGLSKTNVDGYMALRSLYNKERSIMDLFVLIAHSFNNQMRFNSKGGYNMPFGERYFNDTMDNNLREFIDKIQKENFVFISHDFRDLKIDKLTPNDFVYCDPPYLITIASYNENGGWGEKEERDLLNLLDKCDEKGIKFGLSNVLENKGKENTILKEWSKKYFVHHLNNTYANCSYHTKDKSLGTTDEVFITNYKVADSNIFDQQNSKEEN